MCWNRRRALPALSDISRTMRCAGLPLEFLGYHRLSEARSLGLRRCKDVCANSIFHLILLHKELHSIHDPTSAHIDTALPDGELFGGGSDGKPFHMSQPES